MVSSVSGELSSVGEGASSARPGQRGRLQRVAAPPACRRTHTGFEEHEARRANMLDLLPPASVQIRLEKLP